MLTDIFSSFDPMSFSSIMHSQLTMSLSVMVMLILQLSFWSAMNRYSIMITYIMSLIFMQLTRTFSIHLKGLSTSISSLFIILISINLLGLNPYSLSLSSHLIFTLAFGLPLWLNMISSSLTFKPKAFIAHFLPDGAPTWLNPFLILIETVSISVRPLTLSFRLAANMSAGHIVLGLVGLYAAASMAKITIITLILIMITIIYISFEVAICMIQAYIFCLLLSLYADDHAHRH